MASQKNLVYTYGRKNLQSTRTKTKLTHYFEGQ
jgi:hypothetical protein